jgi:hypothetical protein
VPVKAIIQISMIVVGFYTSEKYRLQAEDMKRSAESVGLKCEITQKPDHGSWWLNCNQKSAFLVECLEKYGNEPVLYQDADTRFLKYPILLDSLDADMAAFFYSPRVPIGGTLWFNGKTRAMRYVSRWARIVADHPTREDDSINFREALSSMSNARIQHLPPAYCWNEGSMRGSFPTADPVITHSFIGAHDYPVMKL